MIGMSMMTFKTGSAPPPPPPTLNRVSPINLTGDSSNVIKNAEYNNGLYAAWHVFDGNDTTTWFAHQSSSYTWIGYHFTNPQNVMQYKFHGGGAHYSYAWRLEYSDDGTNWSTADTQTGKNIGNAWWDSGTITSSGAHTYWRIYWTSGNDLLNLEIASVEFWAPWTSPIMTSANTPSPYVVSDLYHYSANPSWFCFNGNGATDWWDSAYASPVGMWTMLDCGATYSPCIKSMTIRYVYNGAPTQFKIQGSNDASNWIDQATINPVNDNTNTQRFSWTGDGQHYRYWRYYNVSSANSYLYIAEITYSE